MNNIKLASEAVETWRKSFGDVFVDRDREVRSLITALIAREHVLLLGPPGTAKSALINQFASSLGKSYFTKLMTKFTHPTEVFGPLDVLKFREGEYRTIVDGFLPTADFVLLDEIFKSNSAILNSLLTALNERKYDQGNTRIDIPLIMCIGASNEDAAPGLEAVSDRFAVRRIVTDISTETGVKRLLRLKDDAKVMDIEWAHIEALQSAVSDVNIDGVIDTAIKLFDELRRTHGIRVSDRKKRKAIKLVKAAAIARGAMSAEARDLRILADALWNTIAEQPLVESAFVTIVGDDDSIVARRLLAEVSAAYEKISSKHNSKKKSDINEIGPLIKEFNTRYREFSQEVSTRTFDEKSDVVNEAKSIANQVKKITNALVSY